MSSHWLMKSEPVKYSYQDLERDGRTVWDGVRNNQAAIYLRSMKIGDRGFFYHSNEGLAVVGIMQVVKEAFIDPSDPNGRFPAVEVAPVELVPQPVTLATMKATPELKGMAMFRQFRLSVTPVTPEEWAVICKLGGLRR